MFSRTQGGFRLVAVFLTLLLAVTMLPAAGMQAAFADEPAERPATTGGNVALQGAGAETADASVAPAATEGLSYSVADGKATLVGFQEGAVLEGAVVVPETVDGATVMAVEMVEGQVAEGVTSLMLPQTVESVKTEGLAAAFPSLASIEVDGTAGVYSTSGGMLFLQGRDAASSDGSTTLAKNRELVWAPPALVVARLPIECKSIAAGAFADAAALETVMSPGVMESIAVAEKDDGGNVTKPGAFTDEQIQNLSIVVPGTNIASPSGDRVSASIALSEDEGMEAKREAWWKYGFNSDKIVMGTSFGEVEGVVAVSDDGTVADASINVLKSYEKSALAEAAESGDEEAAARLAASEGNGLSFSYNADMNLSVGWAGDKTATPATIEIPAYVTIDGVKYAVAEVTPEGFKGAVFLTSVTIPEGVRVIGESAFEDCANLKEVKLPSTLHTIDYAAFRGCTALESADVPESVTWIGGEAFEGCSKAVSDGVERQSGAMLAGASADMSNNIDTYAAGMDVKVKYHEIPANYEIHYLKSSPTKYWSTYVAANPSLSDGAIDLKEGLMLTPTLSDSTKMAIYYDRHATNGNDLHLNTTGSLPDSAFDKNLDGYDFGLFKRTDGALQNVNINKTLVLYEARNTELQGGIEGFKFFTLTDNTLWLSAATMKVHLDYGDADSAVAESDKALGFCYPSESDTYTNLPDITTMRPGYYGLWTYTDSAGTEKEVTAETTLSETTTEPHTLKAKFVQDPTTLSVTPSIGYDGADFSFVASDGDYNASTVTWSDGALKIKADAVKNHVGKTWVQLGSNGNLDFYKDAAGGSSVITLKPRIASGYHFDKWTLDEGTAGAVDIGSARTPIECVQDHTLKCVAAPNTDNTLRLLPGVAAWSDGGGTVKTVTYTTGDAVALDKSAHLDGFWLTGWVWDTPESAGVHLALPEGESRTAPRFEVPAGSYGNATLRAVWTPKRYVVDYDVSKAGDAFKGAFGTEASPTDKPDSGTFISETAVSYIDSTKYSSDEGAPMMAEWDKGYAEQPGYLHSKDNAVWIDTSGIDSEFAHGRDLAGKTDDPAAGDLAIPGYGFLGWTTSAGHNFDGSTLPGDVAYDMAKDGKLPMSSVFAAQWNNPTLNLVPGDGDLSNHATLYGVWRHRSMPDAGITLGSNGAPDKNNEGKVVCDSDGRSVTAGTTAIYYWQGRGLLSGDERAVMFTDSPVRKTPGEIGTEMGLAAPVRYGFEFLGWGVPGERDGNGKLAEGKTDTLYISYDEDAARDPKDSAKVVPGKGFKLTEAGAALMAGDPENLSNVAWQAVWAIRGVDVTLRIPSYAVSDVDVEGWSTQKGHEVKGDATKYDYAGYAWYEGNAAETEQGANSNWWIAKRTWNYFDLVEYPSFQTQKDRYTYDGWYDLMKPSMTDSTDKALTDLGDAVKRVATFEDLRMPNRLVYATGDGEAGDGASGGLSIGETYFTVGDPNAQSAGAKTLWLWTSPIRINVAAPVGVYLCTTNSYGQAVKPFVVGNDTRTQLEAQATFQVSTGSHDLQLVGVTAEDVTAFGYQTDESGNVVRTDDGYGVPVVDGGTIEAGEAASGMADKILNPRFADASGSKDEKVTYDDETSRMFWVSPVPTATADQTGVVYKGDSTAQAEAGKVPGTSNLAGDEGALKPDVETRRYFGFGYRTGEGADPDNRIEDSLPGAADGNEQQLDGFVLRRYDNYQADKNGLAVVAHDDGSTTYRFYYGLDMRRADFDLTGLQELIDNNDQIDYNSAFDQPLLRVKFTFAAARNDGISYFSARGADEGAAEKIPEDTVITVGAAE